ncbi:Uncharacterised protein [Listeria ivanovii subsp. londoniensis]|uniref:Uncharacterized protein n=2 Tax=Listeria ivanovii TaxID=1638 RepID=A0ABS1G2Y8_LISIV|nr:hypothetical protein [Listeria ivanovii]EFR98045.1 hypothetical protein NT05LI_0618 [Listeria ivanovii FSL F6-596]AIS58908.1 hypothetical protein JL58_02465 [Listeria ivanovii subsp. londoniensis]MBK1961238.1 hypothetical protein [Listeria ivanovii subsp. londoniensis]SDX14105.1 hypothetical protein SAMN05421782_111103 [Listeria ivanovii]VEH44886.1 Uncharacterised protein [Listeria ivanovii subsp. londoniensis]
MREWVIKEENIEYKISLGRLTYLKGNKNEWESVIKSILSYFNNRKTMTIISQDNQILKPKDYQMVFLKQEAMLDVYDTNNNYLKSKKDDFINKVMLSPMYQDFLESWEMLQEEVDFLSKQKKILAQDKFSLLSFDKKDLTKKLNWEIINSDFSDEDKKLELINLYAKELFNKQVLFFIEMPEKTIISEEGIKKFQLHVEKMLTRGINVFIISEHIWMDGVTNHFYFNDVVNELQILAKKEQIFERIPLFVEESDWIKAINWSMLAVDNYGGKMVELKLEAVDNLVVFVLVYFIFIYNEWRIIVDYKGIPANIIVYLDRLI